MNKAICIGLLAHVDAGKTTLSEAILYKTGEIRKLGRVDHGDSYLDNNEMERNRGITVFSKQAAFKAGDTAVTMLDTPGHVDFSAEMERTLSVIDYGLLIVSASEGVQSHTETLWRLLRNRNIPTIIFINKMDLAVREKAAILAELADKLGSGFFDANLSGDDFIDAVTLASSSLEDKVLNGEDLTNTDIAEAVSRRELFPCCFGSALKLDGIDTLLENIDSFTLPSHFYNNEDAFGARIFKIMRDHNDERLTFMRLTGGSISSRDMLSGNDWQEKINQIRVYSGMKFERKDTANAGDVVAVTGLSHTLPGDALGAAIATDEDELEPFVMHSVISVVDANGTVPDNTTLLNVFKRLAEEDPKLYVAWDSDNSQITLRLMGQMQLEILQQLLQNRYGYSVEFGPAKIIYKESISRIVEGAGHFEPLRHYAEVHLILEPGEAGSGIVIDSIAPEDHLARNWQHLILTHLEEKEHLGVLINAPITDMKITLAAGRAHDKHTNGGDFREATYRALRHGLMQAREAGAAVLLEPYCTYSIRLDAGNVGRAMTDLEQFSNISNISQGENEAILEGRAPSGAMMEYLPVLTTITGGKCSVAIRQAGYAPCHNTEEVLTASNYDPERDVHNSADSVFVSHTESSIVHWSEAMERMHIPSVLKGNISETTNEIVNQARREAYRKAVATDSELKAIFERTYGKTHKSIRKSSVVRQYQRETAAEFAARNEERNQEIKEKHQHSAPVNNAEAEPTVVLIDGYNLINSDNDLSEMAKIDIGAARDMLIDRLINYQGYMQYEVIVVFDAYKVSGGTGEDEKIFGVRVVYTSQDEPADIRIGLMASTYDRKRNVRIVSSDGLVQQNALVNNALRVPCSEFLRELSDVEDEISCIIE